MKKTSIVLVLLMIIGASLFGVSTYFLYGNAAEVSMLFNRPISLGEMKMWVSMQEGGFLVFMAASSMALATSVFKRI